MRGAETLLGVIFLIMGLLSLVCSLWNIDWFFKTENASLFVRKFGRKGARFIYGLTGAAIIFFAILLISGFL